MKKLLSVVAGVALFSSLAMADHAVQAKDGLGDFLIAPIYYAKGNICTKIVVENTNNTHSILAKVAIREQIASNEVDFPIFLSPGDVWSGTLCQKNGDVVLTSTDDSNHPKIASLLANGKDITKQSYKAGNVNVDFTNGYIEVYPIAEFDEGKNPPKINKSVLVKRWDMLIKGEIPSNTIKTGVDGYSLTGEVEFETNNNVTAILPMTAFKGTNDKVLTGSAVAYGNDTSPDLLLGKDKTYQLLKIMQHNATMFHYSNYGKNQYIAFTFPFGYNKDQVRTYKVIVRDMEENKDVKQETVIFSPTPVIKNSNEIKNEVAIIPVSDIITKTKNPSMFKEGQIQIVDITNKSNVQLGSNQNASFIPTFITTSKNTSKEYINSASYLPTK